MPTAHRCDTQSAATQRLLHQCLVRQILEWRALRGLDWMRGYIKGWAAWPKIKDDFADQWAKGNRGAEGDWR
ncbi:MAG: hypothetical protein ACK5NW_02935 [Ottowia sp.]